MDAAVARSSASYWFGAVAASWLRPLCSPASLRPALTRPPRWPGCSLPASYSDRSSCRRASSGDVKGLGLSCGGGPGVAVRGCVLGRGGRGAAPGALLCRLCCAACLGLGACEGRCSEAEQRQRRVPARDCRSSYIAAHRRKGWNAAAVCRLLQMFG